MQIGAYYIDIPVALAPMAGITDKPFRQLCIQFGAWWTVGEMLSSDASLRHTRKTLRRSDRQGETGVIVAQIVGSYPKQLVEATQYNVAMGAQVIDINMGCPMKKVCNVLAGSALLKDEALVATILKEVVKSVDVPVTLKTRLGWHDDHQNILTIARLAEDAGIAALAIHGRTRTQMYGGEARYELITEVKSHVSLPVWVNGDMDSPQKAWQVMHETGADGVMIGRAAQGQPWLFRDLKAYLENKQLPITLTLTECCDVVLKHIQSMHQFYGEVAGVRVARKHIGWYLASLPNGEQARREINRLYSSAAQYDAVAKFLEQLSQHMDSWPCPYRQEVF